MYKEITIRISPKEASFPELYKQIAASKLGLSLTKITAVRLLRKSIDARKKQIFIDLLLGVYVDEQPTESFISAFQFKDVTSSNSVVIVGSGPAGLFAALKCIELGIKPIVLERGKNVHDRKRDIAQISRSQYVNSESNWCFGEGGAGTFSDGKLYTRSLKRGNVNEILELLVYHGASPEILYEAHPHVGTDKLPTVISNIREKIIKHGGEVHFSTLVNDLIIENGEVRGVKSADGRIFLGPVILATGHSARDVYSLLNDKNIRLDIKGFAMGVRVEHPQEMIDQIQYHSPKGRGNFLPAASYSLACQVEKRGVYSFCMCPGGFMVPSATANDELVVNGMSPSGRNSKWANSGIIVEIRPDDIPGISKHGVLAGIRYQNFLEKEAYFRAGNSQKAPAQRLADFVEGKRSSDLPMSSYTPGLTVSDLHNWLPKELQTRLRGAFTIFNQKMRGFVTNEAYIAGVESRTSSPVRIPRDPISLQHFEINGLFPCGEGAGYAGGIVSSAIDGQRAAIAVFRFINPDSTFK